MLKSAEGKGKIIRSRHIFLVHLMGVAAPSSVLETPPTLFNPLFPVSELPRYQDLIRAALPAAASQPREEAGNGEEEEGRCFAKRVGQGERGPGRKGKRERAFSARFLKEVEEKGLRNIFPFPPSGRERASFGTAALEEESPRLLLACLGWDGSCLVGKG